MVAGTLFLAVVAVAWAYILWSRRKFYMCALKMKGPWGYPLIGNLHKFFKLEEFQNVLSNYCKEYQTRSCLFWAGPFPMVYTIDPAVADIVLHSPDCLNKSIPYKIPDDAIGNGLLTNKPPKWNRHRKILTPCFGYKVLMAKMPALNKYARDFCKEIDSYVERGKVDIKHVSLLISVKSSIGLTMGIDVETDSKIVHAFESIVKLIVSRMLRPWLIYMPIYSWTSDGKHYQETRATIRNYITDLVKTKLKANTAQDAEGKEKVSHVIIDYAVSLYEQKEFTMEEVVDEVTTMVIGGFESTATTVCFTLVYLSMHPEFQERVFDEISTLFEDREFEVTFDDLKDMVYLEMCINETMRLMPTVPLLGRVCEKDLCISEDITIPAGTQIVIDAFSIHRDEDIWGPLANTYNPDNFLPSNLGDKHGCAFMPFSKGKRNCLGWQYGGMFLKVILAQILRKYKLSTNTRFKDMKAQPLLSANFATTPLLHVERR